MAHMKGSGPPSVVMEAPKQRGNPGPAPQRPAPTAPRPPPPAAAAAPAAQPAGEPATPKQVTVTITRQANERLGLGCTLNKDTATIRISSLAGAAERCKELLVNDVLVTINDKPIKALVDVTDVMKAIPHEAPLTVSVIRGIKPAIAPTATASGAKDDPKAVKHSVDVSLEYEEGEPVGVFINKELTVCRITPGSIASDKLRLEDKILAVQGFPLKDEKSFYDKLFRSAPLCTVRVERFGVPGTKAPPAKQQGAAAPPPPFKSSDHNRKTINMVLKDGEPLGVMPDEALEIVRIQPDTAGAKLFHVGDVIEMVNKQELMDINHFYEMLEKGHPNFEIVVDRSKYRESELEFEKLPESAEKLVQRRHGFKYGVRTIKMEQGREYGLGLANCAHNRVVVSVLKPNSTASDIFQPFDRIIAINGFPVTDENVAKEYIGAASGNFSAVIERAADEEHYNQIAQQYEQFKTQRARERASRPEDILPMDAILIAQAYKARRLNKNLTPAPIIIKRAPVNPCKTHKHLSFNETPNKIEIISDVPPGKQLRKCA